MARKKVEKTPLSPKEAASKEFAMTSCVHSGDPSYRFEVGDSVSIGALKNCVVDEVCEDGKYYGLFNNQPKTKDQLYEFYLHIIKEFPFVILEDPFNEDDYDTTAALTKDSGIQIVGDDLFTTNIRRVAHGVTKGAANTVLLKVNQIGTISEALEMIQYAYKFGYAVMPSDSRGEGESIADYAVGINAGSVRECGIGPRANRFMEIEAELGKTAKFLGARGLKGFKNQQRADALERKE